MSVEANNAPLVDEELQMIDQADYLGEAAARIASSRGISFANAVDMIEAAWMRDAL